MSLAAAAPLVHTDADVLEALAFEPPCDIAQYHRTSSAPASLAVFAVVPQPCGCVPPRPLVLMCKPCWDDYQDTWIRCPECQARMPFATTVRLVVAL